MQRKHERTIGGTRYSYWPGFIPQAQRYIEIDKKITGFGEVPDPAALPEIGALVVEQIRLWIPDLKDEDIACYDFGELKMLAMELYFESTGVDIATLRTPLKNAMKAARKAAARKASTPRKKSKRRSG